MLKKFFIFFAMSVTCITFSKVGLTSNRSLFMQGNTLFLSGKYMQALVCYQQIEHKNSGVWHNMGNCCFNNKQYAQALIFYFRARAGATWKQLGQLEGVIAKSLKKLNQPAPLWISMQIKKVLMLLPIEFMQIGLLFFLTCLFAYLYLMFFGAKGFYVFKREPLIVFIVLIIIFLLTLHMQRNEIDKKIAVIVRDQSVVYAGPDRTFHQTQALPIGTQVVVEKSSELMHKIKWINKTGWIARESLEII